MSISGILIFLFLKKHTAIKMSAFANISAKRTFGMRTYAPGISDTSFATLFTAYAGAVRAYAKTEIIPEGIKTVKIANIYDIARSSGTTGITMRLLITDTAEKAPKIFTRNGMVKIVVEILIAMLSRINENFFSERLNLRIILTPARTPHVAENDRRKEASFIEYGSERSMVIPIAKRLASGE